MSQTDKKMWEDLGFQVIEIPDTGDVVICDLCGVDYTDSSQSGGVFFAGKAVCPECSPTLVVSAKKYNEEKYIKATCPESKSFADWVREDLR